MGIRRGCVLPPCLLSVLTLLLLVSLLLVHGAALAHWVQDSALLIFKAQVEVAFRDQTANRNALLLFSVLCHGLMEQQLANAYKELSAKQAEVRVCVCVAGVGGGGCGQEGRHAM